MDVGITQGRGRLRANYHLITLDQVGRSVPALCNAWPNREFGWAEVRYAATTLPKDFLCRKCVRRAAAQPGEGTQ